jgi:hypothetical protein
VTFWQSASSTPLRKYRVLTEAWAPPPSPTCRATDVALSLLSSSNSTWKAGKATRFMPFSGSSLSSLR